MANTTVFRNVRILDSTGQAPFAGTVTIRGNRIADVSHGSRAGSDNDKVIDAGGATLMSGLCDAHTHLSWTNEAGIDALASMPVEEHTLQTAENARLYLDRGYTMCVGAAAAKPRLDVAIRNFINAGKIPGPRYLANGPEIATVKGLGNLNPSYVGSYAEVITGPSEMRSCVRRLLEQGVDLVKINCSGEGVTNVSAEETTMTEDEFAAGVREAHGKAGIRVCVHARSAEAVKLCVRHGAEIIYHASYADEEALDLLEANKTRHFVVPGLAWLYQICHGASEWGVTPQVASHLGYARELEVAVEAMKAMKKRGIRVLPGGDYGFAWTPHGTNARDLQYFVELLGFSTMETIIAATALGGEVMARGAELGKIKAGYLADLILVNGDPLTDITLLQQPLQLLAVMKDGVFHKEWQESC